MKALTDKQKLEKIHAALLATEFGFMHRRCPACVGFNMSEAGETDRVHTPNCIVKEALSIVERMLRNDPTNIQRST